MEVDLAAGVHLAGHLGRSKAEVAGSAKKKRLPQASAT